MYLGNLSHANNADLLVAMGIKQILSVGEPTGWGQKRIEEWGRDKMMIVDRVQDNGVDSLTDQFDRCLEFLREFLFDDCAETRPTDEEPQRLEKPPEPRRLSTAA